MSQEQEDFDVGEIAARSLTISWRKVVLSSYGEQR